MVTLTYLKPTYLPAYLPTYMTVVTVVTEVTEVTIVTVVTVVTKKLKFSKKKKIMKKISTKLVSKKIYFKSKLTLTLTKHLPVT